MDSKCAISFLQPQLCSIFITIMLLKKKQPSLEKRSENKYVLSFFFPHQEHDANIIRLMDLLQWLLGRILMGYIQPGHYHPVKTIQLHSRRITLMLSSLLKKKNQWEHYSPSVCYRERNWTPPERWRKREREGGRTGGESKSWREKGKNRGKITDWYESSVQQLSFLCLLLYSMQCHLWVSRKSSAHCCCNSLGELPRAKWLIVLLLWKQ